MFDEIDWMALHPKKQHVTSRHCSRYLPESPNQKGFPTTHCLKSATHLSGGPGRGGGGGARAVLQREVSDEDDELGECAADLGARALEQVLREPVGVSKQDLVCKPIAYILTVSQQDAEGVIPGRGMGGHRECGQRGGRGENRKQKPEEAELTSRWRAPVRLSWCENLC